LVLCFFYFFLADFKELSSYSVSSSASLFGILTTLGMFAFPLRALSKSCVEPFTACFLKNLFFSSFICFNNPSSSFSSSSRVCLRSTVPPILAYASIFFDLLSKFISCSISFSNTVFMILVNFFIILLNWGKIYAALRPRSTSISSTFLN